VARNIDFKEAPIRACFLLLKRPPICLSPSIGISAYFGFELPQSGIFS
jgi:hypothetical protein